MARFGVFLFCLITEFIGDARAGTIEARPRSAAQRYIESFRKGDDLRVHEQIGTLATTGGIEKSELTLLTKELVSGTSSVREKIVRLLEKTGLELDTNGGKQLPVIRDHSIIKALLIEGFEKPDAAAHSASKILRERCVPADLALYADMYTASLMRKKSDYLYIVAKAKTLQATRLVDELAKLPSLQNDKYLLEEIRITQAALGNATNEEHYIQATFDAERSAPPAPPNRFYDVGEAKDGRQLAESLDILGLIGTKRSLGILCSYLRSPIKTYVPNIKERSIRYYALDAIRYNFPDKRILLRPVDVADWAAVEHFCTQNIGFVFDGPTPILPRDNFYPTRMLSPAK